MSEERKRNGLHCFFSREFKIFPENFVREKEEGFRL